MTEFRLQGEIRSAMFFEEIVLGKVYETGPRVLTRDVILKFGELTGDNHPLHTDDTYAKSESFDGIIAHGLLSLSFMAGLKSELNLYRDSSIASLGWDKIRFLRPVLAGSRVRARTEFIDKQPSSKAGQGTVRQLVKLLGEKDDELVSGEHVMLLRMRPKTT